MNPCSQCGVRTGEPDFVCTFCRVRTRWWTTVDSLPIGLRGWCISNIRIWTGIVQEEIDRFEEIEKAKASVTATATSKSASPVVRGDTPTKGSKEEAADRPDKTWIAPKKEGDKPRSPKGAPGVEEIDSPAEEGKHSSGSRQHKEEKTPRKRSRSERKRDRSRSKRSRHRRRRSSSRRSRHPKEDRDKKREHSEKGKEKKAKPSVRPPRTPSRSPPGDRGGPPPKHPPVERRGGPPDPVARPTGRAWSGTFKAWQKAPQYWGVNKGVKKKENQYYYRR